MYGTTERDPQTGKVRWRELKVAAVYEATAAREPEPAAGQVSVIRRQRNRCGPAWRVGSRTGTTNAGRTRSRRGDPHHS